GPTRDAEVCVISLRTAEHMAGGRERVGATELRTDAIDLHLGAGLEPRVALACPVRLEIAVGELRSDALSERISLVRRHDRAVGVAEVQLLVDHDHLEIDAAGESP